MTKIKLKISDLRKQKGIGQQELATVLGVSFQSVSKWETGATMPDISLLPGIAEYFNVTVDELLGLKPLRYQQYLPRNTDNRDHWNDKTDKLYQNRKYFWNDDYLTFLVENVWCIKSPIDVIDLRCGDGYLGKKLLEILPEGSTYTGVDNEYFINKAKRTFENTEIASEFIVTDIYYLVTGKKYDLAICQGCLRHLNKPLDALAKMVETVKKGGMVVCVEVNRELENDGIYIDGLGYDYLCTNFDYHTLWRKELENEGRDYAIGMRLPFFMQQLGLHNIDIRMNDKVMFTYPEKQDYEEVLQDFVQIGGWDTIHSQTDNENLIEFFMTRGINRIDAEKFVMMQEKISTHFAQPDTVKSFLKVQGLLIVYGTK